MARRASWGSRAPGPELGLGQAGREPQGRRLRYNCAFPFPGGNRCASLPAATNGLYSRSSPLIKGDSLLSELLLRFFSLVRGEIAIGFMVMAFLLISKRPSHCSLPLRKEGLPSTASQLL